MTALALPHPSRVYAGDARSLALSIPSGTVDLVFTDPPYPRDYLPLYGWLAHMAARVLKPGGWCLAMGGGAYADEILTMMSEHLTYHYTLHVYMRASGTAALRPHGQTTPIISRTKPIYAFAKGRSMPRTVVQTPFSGSGNDKRFDEWGQDAQSARYFVDCFSQEGDLVLDPFCGGGTTPVVCQALARRWLAFDINPKDVATTRARLRNPLYLPVQNGQLVLEFAS